MATTIHPSAMIAEGAELGVDVVVGPYVVIGPAVRIGDGTRIGPHVVIDGHTTLGKENVVVGQASLGGAPQDVTYRGEPTILEMGDRNVVHEFVTINRGTVKGGGITTIGSNCLFMACSHVAHDCVVEDDVHLTNGSIIGGHVHMQQGAKLGGTCGVHQFVTLGRFAYAGGMTKITTDVPPFMLVEGQGTRVWKVNDTGLRREGFSEADIESLRWAHREIYRSGNPRRSTLQRLREHPNATPVVIELVEFLENIERGSHGRYRECLREEQFRQGTQRILGEARTA